MLNKFLILFLLLFSSQFILASETCNNIENDPLFDELKNDIKKCNAHDIHITFDDGPSTIATAKILDKLKARNTKATFFISTTNLEKSTELQNLITRELNEGHVVGDHGYEHNAYDLRMINGKVEENGFSPAARTNQIVKSIELLNKASSGRFSQQKNLLFRFPYGRGAMPSPDELNQMEQSKKIVFESKSYSERLNQYRKLSPAVEAIAEKGFSHLGWNHDSEDFKYTVKNDTEVSVKDFVKENLNRMCNSKEKNQVALFHDIKSINVKAIPLIVDVGRCLGLKFVSAKELLISETQLTKSGVLIPKDFQLKGAAQNVDNLDKLISKLNCSTCEIITPPTHNSCISNNGKTYKHCEGEDSICINGEWESRPKVLLEQKCKI
jgi:peptidoglycan/xylan/chitin deacetylase (PgdA/CDA1 family)